MNIGLEKKRSHTYIKKKKRKGGEGGGRSNTCNIKHHRFMYKT